MHVTGELMYCTCDWQHCICRMAPPNFRYDHACFAINAHTVRNVSFQKAATVHNSAPYNVQLHSQPGPPPWYRKRYSQPGPPPWYRKRYSQPGPPPLGTGSVTLSQALPLGTGSVILSARLFSSVSFQNSRGDKIVVWWSREGSMSCLTSVTLLGSRGAAAKTQRGGIPPTTPQMKPCYASAAGVCLECGYLCSY